MPHQLSKLYDEPTTACNLDCAMCVRHVWGEPAVRMRTESFAERMSQRALGAELAVGARGATMRRNHVG